jgi:hypothetical protein
VNASRHRRCAAAGTTTPAATAAPAPSTAVLRCEDAATGNHQSHEKHCTK